MEKANENKKVIAAC